MNALVLNAGDSTKTRILNAAEKLFGDKGFDATSLRDITAEAQVNLAAVNYHFQTKESLIEAVIARRIAPLTVRRIQMLEAAGSEPTLEQVIEAFISPLLEATALHSVHLIGRVLASPDQFLERVFRAHIAPMAQRFSTALARVAPHLSPEERFWRLQFMAGSMTHILALWGVLPRMSGELCAEVDQKTLIPRLVTFLAAGFRAAATASEGGGSDDSAEFSETRYNASPK